MDTDRCPVGDWATDFNIFDEVYSADPGPFWDELRASGCPVATTDRWGGQVLPINWEDLVAVTSDTEHFSSETVGVTGPKPGETTLLMAPPITSDPPNHTLDRRHILPAFSPRSIDRMTPITEGFARDLIARIKADEVDVVDAAERYARLIPVKVISRMLGVPAPDEDLFTDWVKRILQIGPTDLEVGAAATRELLAYFAELIERRRDDPSPPDDLINDLMQVRVDGAPLPVKHLLGSCFLLLVAGIDTTWSSIGSALYHLGTHLEDKARLLDEPELIPTAIEELLRVYSPVTMARIVTKETELQGHKLVPGDRVLLPFPAANRDPEMFENPNDVKIDREHNRHAAFGLGIHRCAGSNLARMELQVAVREWLTAFPNYRIAPGAKVAWTGGQVRGPREIPVTLG